MKVVFGALAVSVVLATSACGSAHAVGRPGPDAKRDFVTVHAPSLANLPRAVRKNVEFEIRAAKHPVDPATVNMIEVYGPGTRTALNAAAGGGEGVAPWAHKDYYLTVLYGHFVCDSCSRPPGAATPRGSVEWFVWSSPTSGGSDFGLVRKLPPAVSRLHRLTRITLSYAGRL
jgi:hypothetical protein